MSHDSHSPASAQQAHDRRVDYLEFPVPDVSVARAFYGAVFGWRFEDWGPGYTSFSDGRLSGGFRGGEPATVGGPLVVLYAVDLPAIAAAVVASGGTIVQPAYAFPGGWRFHFRDPSGHELAVWSETERPALATGGFQKPTSEA